MVRVKTKPKVVDVVNYTGSQQLFSQEPYQPQHANLIENERPRNGLVDYSYQSSKMTNRSSQLTSTPMHRGASQALPAFDDMSPLSRTTENVFQTPEPRQPLRQLNQGASRSTDMPPPARGRFSFHDDALSTFSGPSVAARSLYSVPSTTIRSEPRRVTYNDDSSVISGATFGGRRRVDNSGIHIARGKVVKKTKKSAPGTAALKEIRKYQANGNSLLKVAPFARVVKDLIEKIAGPGYRVQGLAVKALMEGAENFLVTLFETANMAAHHAKRVTLQQKDMHLVLRILDAWGIKL
uniref:Histone domain-containing protein n=1 Tax=Panagrellus redivivus TaxID=6233 RepID=A0A7E4ZW21_PANRE